MHKTRTRPQELSQERSLFLFLFLLLATTANHKSRIINAESNYHEHIPEIQCIHFSHRPPLMLYKTYGNLLPVTYIVRISLKYTKSPLL